MMVSVFLCGCSHIDGEFPAGSNFKEANDFFSQGFFTASLSKYEQIIDKYPNTGDRALFEMGMIYVHPGNKLKNYQKALECFEKLIKDYPESEYRQDSEVMISLANDAATKSKNIISQKIRIESLEREVKNKGAEIVELQKKTDPLEQELKCKANEIIVLQEKIDALKQFIFAVENGPADKILIEKKDRRLTLISKNKVLKTYKIALGGEIRMALKKSRVITKPRRETTSSIQKTIVNVTTYAFIFPILMRKTKSGHTNLVFLPAVIS